MQDESIFAEAIKLPADQREAYLTRCCGTDESRVRRIRELIRQHQADDSFMADAAIAATQTHDAEREANPPAIDGWIGPYKIREAIGQGGMGIVYVAEQFEPVRRKVALKVIKPGMDTREVVARFEAERQALAMMDHPGIAKVFDAGMTDTGRPYFAMELINGIPITAYCDQNRLGIDARLRLFMQVCQAVQHAHQKGVIHRDVKPSNVLVTRHDGNAVPVVIDFGVAKATSQNLTEQTIYTRLNQVIGTTLYMSPEQAELSRYGVDTRTDVYSLGVLLYELLTGTTPFDRDRLNTAAFDEVRRIIREEEPPKPSTRISTLGDTATELSASRGMEPAKLRHSVRGDLDWIVMKALEKDRNRRYESPGRFADDVQNYLADEVIAARPPSAVYQLQKFWRRNRAVASTLGTIVLSLSLGLGLAIWRWQEERRTAEQLQTTLDKLWDVLADRALDAAFSGNLGESRVAIGDAENANAPKELLNTLKGLSYVFAGDYQEAIRLLEEAESDDPDSRMVLSALAWVYEAHAMYGKLEDSQDRLRKLPPSDSPELSDYESLFVSMASFVEGPTSQIKSSLEQVDALLNKKAHWGVAWALRSRFQTEVAAEEQDLAACQQAVEDYQRARKLLPESDFVETLGFFAVVQAIELSTSRGETRSDWMEMGRQLSLKFQQPGTSQLGKRSAHVFEKRFGDEQIAAKLESELIEEAVEGTIMHAAEHYQFRRNRLPLDRWLQDDASDEKRICATMCLASSMPGDSEIERATHVVRSIIRQDTTPATYVICMDIACLLGDQNLGEEIIRLAKRSEKLNNDWRWWQRSIDFYDAPDPNELLDRSGPFHAAANQAHYLVGMNALMNRDRETAQENFEKAVAYAGVTFWNYHCPQVWLKRMKEDRGWPGPPVTARGADHE